MSPSLVAMITYALMYSCAICLKRISPFWRKILQLEAARVLFGLVSIPQDGIKICIDSHVTILTVSP